MSNTINLKAIEERCEKARELKWGYGYLDDTPFRDENGSLVIYDCEGDRICSLHRDEWSPEGDDRDQGDYILEAANNLPALVAWARRARVCLQYVEENCRNPDNQCEECDEILRLLEELRDE